MNEPVRELEGTWEEVARHEAELSGQYVKLTIVEGQQTSAATANTMELPRGSFARITEGLRRFPLDADTNPDLWEIIAAERAARRKIAQEKSE